MKKKLFFVIAILLLTANFSQAQSGPSDYVITTKGDTLTAQIKHNFWGHVAYVLPNQQAQLVNNGAIKEYYWMAKKHPVYVAISLPGKPKPVFAALLERGKINLYEFISSNNKGSIKYWYASKADSPVVEIINEKRLFGVDKNLVKNFNNLVNDNPQVVKSLKEQHRYSFKNIESLIRQYNAS